MYDLLNTTSVSVVVFFIISLMGGCQIAIEKNIARTSLTWVILIAVLTAIGSEIKIMPFANTTFRFGLGTIIFSYAH